MEKINIAELLKDCPQGMELDCTMYEGLEFDYISAESISTPIICRLKGSDGRYRTYNFTKYGCWSNLEYAKCVIFPKGKTTWEGFHRPFKSGDIIADEHGNIAIYKETMWYNKKLAGYYCGYRKSDNHFILEQKRDGHFGLIEELHFATEEEKVKLFQVIKDNGYRWNEETKTLEKLIEPKFKVGDRIVKQNSIVNSWIVSSVSSEYYGLKLPEGVEGVGVLPVSEQDNYDLLLNTNRFDITTLIPFESKVLVRNCDSDYWKPAIFGFTGKDKNVPFCVEGGNFFNKCIPYEGNEHLLGTRKDCDDFYKTWR